MFDEVRAEYEPDRAELRDLLSDREYTAASRTVINAHYTDPVIAAEVWGAVTGLGFTGGRVLEPGSGAGTFIGLAPQGTRMTGVELDPVTASISQALYPDAVIRAESFADSKLASRSFDAAVGNVPFGRNALHDPRHNQGRHSMHNHFIIKSLDLTRPGGVVAVISSAFTLDARNPAARREIAQTADLLGAVRLPTGAHRRAAGTEALTDVLIFRRRLPGETALDESWLETGAVDVDGQTAHVNRYFLEHPNRVLGDLTVGNGMYGAATLQVRSTDLAAVGLRLRDQLGQITAAAREAGRGFTAPDGAELDRGAERAALLTAGEHEQIGHITDRGTDGFTQVTVDGVHEPLKIGRNHQGELRQLLELRDLGRELLSLEATSVEDTDELGQLRDRLRGAYEAYTAQHGPINRFGQRRTGRTTDDGQDIMARVLPPAVRALRGDPYGPLVPALERFDEATGTAVPAGLLTTRQVQPRRPVLGVDTPDEALAVTLDTVGTVDMDSVARLLGTDVDEARAALGERVYDVPGEPGVFETRAEYLSGDVRTKLDAARAAAVEDGSYQANVDALEAVLPRELGADEIEARVGAVWVSPEIHTRFLRELIGDNSARVERLSGSDWDVKASRYVVAATNEWGTDRMPAGQILKHLAEQRRIQVTDPDPADPDGNRRVINPTETTAAQEKGQIMQERFSEWVWEDPARAAHLVDEYNRRFNSIVLRDYAAEGERLTFPGLVKDWTPQPHQRAAVARMVSEPSVGLFHEVGAGKTAEMVMGATELRRLGMVRKPVVVVPNHMLDQFTREWLQLYPQAQLLAASSEDVAADRRRVFVARAAASDWDGVIMTRGAFERIKLSEDSAAAYQEREMGRQRAELDAARARAAERGEDPMSIKRMEARLQAAEERLKVKGDRPTDPGISFEETGIDYLLVDELHEYKNLSTPSNIADAAIDGSKRATDLHMKVDYLRQRHGDRVITGATATPIANSVTEMYVMQRYLGPEILDRAGISDFDTWAATFGQVTTEMELSVAGGDKFKMKERFAKFQNVPELLRMFHTFADVKTAADLKLPTPDLAVREDGRRLPRMVTVEASEELQAYIADIAERAEAVNAGRVDPREDNMLKISSDGRKAALDLRLVDDAIAPLTATTKVNATADLVASTWADHRDDVFLDPATGEEHPTRGALQIVFCDLGTPGEKWNVYDELKLQLVERGVPGEQVRFIHEAKNDAEKGRLFAAARSGDVAVLIGSTQKMGVGTNIQARAVHLVDMDAPWRPADVAQRHGRIVRRGNQNPEVAISQVVTKGSFDTFMWQTLERKSRFIDQIMRGNLKEREIEDVGENTLSFAEVKAISSGNPLILEKSKAEQELARLERLSRAWHRNQSSLVFRVQSAEQKADAFEKLIPQLRAAAERTTGDLGGENFRMMVDGREYTKRTDAATAWALWAGQHVTTMPPRSGERPVGVAGSIAGHEILVVQREANAIDLSASAVELRLADAPSVFASTERAGMLNPTVGLIQKIENAVGKLPKEVGLVESKLEQARRDASEAREALAAPFKHQAALESARWEVERIDRQMRGDQPPEPTLDAELEAVRRLMRVENVQRGQARAAGEKAHLTIAVTDEVGQNRGYDLND